MGDVAPPLLLGHQHLRRVHAYDRNRRHRARSPRGVPRSRRPRRRARRPGRQIRRRPRRPAHGGRAPARGSGGARGHGGASPARPRRASIRRRSGCASSAPRPRSITRSPSRPTCIACSACRSSAACSRPSTPASAAPRACSPRSTGSRPARRAARRRSSSAPTSRATASNTPGEPTQGAGAVAHARLGEPAPARARGRRDRLVRAGRQRLLASALLEGGRRRRAPLGAVLPRRARRRLQGLAGSVARRRATPTSSRARCYHVPYGKMAKKAHRHVMQLEGASEAEADASYAAEVATSLRPAVAGRQHLHRLVVPGAGVAARGRGGRARRAAHRALQLRLGLLRRVLRGPRGRRARARSPIRSSWPRRSRIAKYSFAEYEQIRLRDEEGDKRPVNGEAHELPEGAIAFVGVDADRRVYIA